MNHLTTLIAWRYLWNKDKDSSISIMIKICFAGILIGTFSLMLTLIITNGFEKVIHEKMRGINAQCIMYSQGNKLDFDGIEAALKKDFGRDVIGISGNSIKQVILDHNKTQTVLFLKGIQPDRESDVTTLTDKIVLPLQQKPGVPQSLETLLKPNHILVGYKTADELTLRIGQTIDILIPEPSGKKRLSLRNATVTIAGIFNVGLEEYDRNFAFIPLESLHEMFDETGVDYITLRFAHDNDSYERKIIHELKDRFEHLTVTSWKELYPALVQSLWLEKYLGFFILALITLVASMNLISLLFMQIQQKRRDIAIFKAMGLEDRKIRSIFLQMGLVITLGASLVGLALAALAGYVLEHYPFIKIPDVYFVSHLPARMDSEIFFVVFCATLLLGILATLIPTMGISRINISQVLRHE